MKSRVMADVIVDLQAGDCGKGKIAHALAPNYDGVMRYNGGGNAGHTIYIGDEKIVTHQVPCGVFSGKVSIIGPECVVNVVELEEEIRMIEAAGFLSVRKYLYVDYRAHVITPHHLEEDGKDTKIGTTRKGIGPAYASKVRRDGVRIGDLDPEEISFKVGDVYDMLHINPSRYFTDWAGGPNWTPHILCEGAQGYQLDINFGNYPFVTSSHCVAGAACLNGLPPTNINKVFGVMKAYQTYVGNDPHWGKSLDPALQEIQKVGGEVGATTGRIRKVDWLDLNSLIPACKINGVSRIYINKLDILETVGRFCVYANGKNVFSTSENFTNFVNSYIEERHDATIIWSRSAKAI